MSTFDNILKKAKEEGKVLDANTVAYTLGFSAGKKSNQGKL